MTTRYERWVDSPRKPEEVDPDKECRGRMQAMRAADWVRSHVDEFAALCVVVEDMKRKDHLRDRVSLECGMRGIALSDKYHPDKAFDHSLWSPVLRYVVLRTGADVPMKVSACDHSGLPYIEEACA